MDSICWTVSEWACYDKEFVNISMHDLLISRTAFL